MTDINVISRQGWAPNTSFVNPLHQLASSVDFEVAKATCKYPLMAHNIQQSGFGSSSVGDTGGAGRANPINNN